MTSLERFLGKTPRLRILDALLRLGDIEFTRPELADEAGLHKPSVYRLVRDLEEEGIIQKVHGARPATYPASAASGRLRLLGTFTAALQILDRRPEREAQVADGFRRLALRGSVSAERSSQAKKRASFPAEEVEIHRDAQSLDLLHEGHIIRTTLRPRAAHVRGVYSKNGEPVVELQSDAEFGSTGNRVGDQGRSDLG